MVCQAKFSWAGKNHAILSHTSAMACWSFSLPAVESCPGRSSSLQHDDSICRACYACQGRYTSTTVMQCLAARLAWVRWHTTTHERQQVWIDTMVRAITQSTKDGGYFRWHDSGDIFSPTYCRMVRSVCARTPYVQHWFPTRSWGLTWVGELRKLNALPNVVVRPSSHGFNEAPPVVDGLADGLSAHTTEQPHKAVVWDCPKAAADNPATNCAIAGCRVCWGDYGTVSYRVHGVGGRHLATHANPNTINRLRAACRRKAGYIPLPVLA